MGNASVFLFYKCDFFVLLIMPQTWLGKNLLQQPRPIQFGDTIRNIHLNIHNNLNEIYLLSKQQ